jgi:hypothetical protein
MLIYVNPSVAEVKKTCKKILKKLFLQALLLLEVVNFRSKILAFCGACGDPAEQGRLRERYIARRKLIFIFEEFRTLRSNQLVNEVSSQ